MTPLIRGNRAKDIRGLAEVQGNGRRHPGRHRSEQPATRYAARGFSFQAEGPLDMRMDPHSERTAEQVVNHLDERQLADVIYEFGEERRSRRIARAICRSRPIRSTAHLADVISAAARPMNQAERRIHPATQDFSGSSNLRKPRTGRSEGAARGSAADSEARWANRSD